MAEEFEPRYDDDMSKPPAFFPGGHEREGGRENDREIRVEIEGFYDLEHPTQASQRVIMLTDEGGRNVRMVIGAFEWLSIQMAKENDLPERPFTHDLMKNILDRMGYAVDRILIDDLWHDVFYAKVFLRKGDDIIEMDSRPSDAIALATRFTAPMYMLESVLDATQAADQEDGVIEDGGDEGGDEEV